MIRKYNYTGRGKINKNRIQISIIDDKPYKSFNASFDLKDLGLSDQAKIYIEPYYKSSFMRFYFGTISKEKKPDNTSLIDIPSTDIIKFRIKVVDETNKVGRILRIADKIKPKKPGDEGNRMSILPIDWSKDLDQQIFRVTFPANDFPILEINGRIENRKELLKNDPIFRSLIFPSVIKDIAVKIAITAASDEFEEGDNSWQSTWLIFIKQVLHVNTEIKFDNDDDEDSINEWVEDVVTAFCRINKFRSKFEQALNKP
jgi:hypothetical protein